jgi:DNA-binding NtrC family response regulator
MRLLVVGRLSGQLGTAVRMAIQAGAKVAHVETIQQATSALRAGQGADLMMVDYDLDIRGLIRANELERILVPVVACGIGADPQKAADAIRQGAQEFIPLPPEAELIAAVLNAVAHEDRALVTRDAGMQAVLRLADQVAASEASILITGESGVGKEVMARYVHGKSRRAEKAFISVNCAAIPRTCWKASCSAREGRLHRRHRPPHRQVRGSRRRHPPARRDQRDGRPPAGQAAARPSGARDRPRRRRQAGEGGHPHHRHLQP